MVTTKPHIFLPAIEALCVRQVQLAQKSISFHAIELNSISILEPLVEIFLLVALKLTSSARKASTLFYNSFKVFAFVLSFHSQITDL
jgi:hypothetical protein